MSKRKSKHSSGKSGETEGAEKLEEGASEKDRKGSTEEESLEERLRAADARAEENYNRLLRVTAEFENYKKTETVELAPSVLKKRIDETVININALGLINMKALEEYKEQKIIYDELKEKVDKLTEERNKILEIMAEIEGKRKTVAKVMPAYPEDRGKSIIQMDGLLRGNAQVSLDEKVTAQKTSCSPADKIVLNPLTLVRSISRERDTRYIGSLLDGLALVEGDTVRANLFGTRSQDFTVVSTVPKRAVLVHSRTKIEVAEKGEAKTRGLRVSYKDIGELGI